MQPIPPLLKFGLMCHTPILPAWQVSSLQQALAIQGVELSVVIINSGSNSALPAARTAGSAGAFSLWSSVQKRLESKLAALLPTSIEKLVADIPQVFGKPANSKDNSYSYEQSDREKIKSLGLDFIICFEPGCEAVSLQDCSRRGVWYFQFGRRASRGAPPGFWEIYRNEPQTSGSLRCANPGVDREIVLREGNLKTITGSYSTNLSQLVQESSRWFGQACKDVLNGVERVELTTGITAENSPRGEPDNLQCLIFYLRLKRNKLRNWFNNLFLHRHWGLALSFSPVQELWQNPESAKVAFLPVPSRDTFHADPCGMAQEEGMAILHEKWNGTRGLGEINGFTLDRAALAELERTAYPGKPPGKPAKVAASVPFKVNLEFPHHCSYPYIFRHQEQYFCIPETGEAAKVSLFRCVDQPGKWIFVTDIITEFAAIDSTIAHLAGKWWLFCTREDDHPDSHLYLWYADELTGPWRQHQNNPVKMDIGSARPAGTPFELDGQLYRPAQDCSRNYGGSISIQKITSLTPTSFSEQPSADLQGLTEFLRVDGMHTLSRVGDVTLLDYYRHAFLPSILMYRLKRYLHSRQQQ